MPARSPASQDGYPSSSPSTEANHTDPFSHQQRYYDNESVDDGRRDTYASDASAPALNDNYYEQNGTYDPYRQSFGLISFLPLKLSHQPHTIQTLTVMYTDSATHPQQNL